MKKITLLLALFVLATTTTFAQLTEGHVKYDITVSSDNPEMAMAIMMFEGSTMDIYFSGDVARTDLNFGALISMSTVADSKSGEVLILMGGMMGNRGVVTSQTEMKEGSEETPETTVELVKGKKTIQGYKCKKAIITDDAGNKMVYWYTKAIKSQNPDVNSPANKIPGFAMEFETNRDGMLMTFVASEVTKSLTDTEKADKLSLTIPEDYEEMSYEEFSNFGGM